MDKMRNIKINKCIHTNKIVLFIYLYYHYYIFKDNVKYIWNIILKNNLKNENRLRQYLFHFFNIFFAKVMGS